MVLLNIGIKQCRNSYIPPYSLSSVLLGISSHIKNEKTYKAVIVCLDLVQVAGSSEAVTFLDGGYLHHICQQLYY